MNVDIPQGSDTMLFITLFMQLGLSIISWILLSVGFTALLGKLQKKGRWMGWVPGLRYFALGKRVEMPKEGLFCCIVEFFQAVVVIIDDVFVTEGKAQTIMQLIRLVLVVLIYVYRIQIFLRLINVFGLRKRWIIPFLLIEWLTMMILGFGKKYQPKTLDFTEDWEAGTAPAEIDSAEKVHRSKLKQTGLSVDLKERVAMDFGKKHYLLKDIALDIPNGSLVLLLGGSGSGKTTLVNAIIGYEKADATVLLNGSDIYRDYDRMKYRIGFVPQKNLIRGNDTVQHTVGDAALLRLPADMTGTERKTKMQDVMDLLGLSAGAEGLVCKKSGGQLRRISIAMELVTDPELFVLDEPDSGLDGVIAREIFTKLRGIADEGKIVIVITHTPDRVIDLFDKVIVLGRDSGRVGRLAFYGSPQEARKFFGKETMEGVVMSVNRKEEGGDGLADECIERYAQLAAAAEGGAAS